MELKPCPKCKKNRKRTIPVKCYFDTRYKVKCLECGFEIDAFIGKEVARGVWNRLPRDEQAV